MFWVRTELGDGKEREENKNDKWTIVSFSCFVRQRKCTIPAKIAADKR